MRAGAIVADDSWQALKAQNDVDASLPELSQKAGDAATLADGDVDELEGRPVATNGGVDKADAPVATDYGVGELESLPVATNANDSVHNAPAPVPEDGASVVVEGGTQYGVRTNALHETQSNAAKAEQQTHEHAAAKPGTAAAAASGQRSRIIDAGQPAQSGKHDTAAPAGAQPATQQTAAGKQQAGSQLHKAGQTDADADKDAEKGTEDADNGQQLTKEEHRERGGIAGNVYGRYVRAVGIEATGALRFVLFFFSSCKSN